MSTTTTTSTTTTEGTQSALLGGPAKGLGSASPGTLGPRLASTVLGFKRELRRAITVSSLWKAARCYRRHLQQDRQPVPSKARSPHMSPLLL